MSMLVTRPEYDSGTRYLSHWASLVIHEAMTKGRRVYDLHREKANRQEFESRMNKLRPIFVFLNGHGSEDAVFGQDDRLMVALHENDALLHGRITYAVACASGAVLGAAVGSAQHSAFIGYDRRFGVVRHSRYLNRPLDDPYATPMREMSNQIPLSLLKGHTRAESVQRAKDIGDRHLQRIQSSTADPDLLQIAQTLWWNMRHLVCRGDANQTLVS